MHFNIISFEGHHNKLSQNDHHKFKHISSVVYQQSIMLVLWDIQKQIFQIQGLHIILIMAHLMVSNRFFMWYFRIHISH